MCGIVGVWHREGARCSPDILCAMRDSLQSRGPDGAGSWTQDNVGLGHRRLAILDLSDAANQPMLSACGNYVIVLNGEIYNFKELRKELANTGSRFSTESDTEVVLEAYRQWGSQCVQRFVGMFAFAVWDNVNKKLFLVRDRVGKKPLYYVSKPNGTVLFGSRLSALLAHPECPREISQDALSLYLELGYVPAPWAILKGVKKVNPGYTLTFTPTDEFESRYWSIDDIKPGAENWSDTNAIESLDNLLRDAVRLRLISDVPLGAFLSGGIDSSIVVALMREVGDQNPETFAIGFREQGYDESAEARAVANYLGTRHHERIMDSKDLLDLLDTHRHAYDEPFADWSSLPTLMVSKFAREFVTVGLGGDGGDELFAGYPYYDFVRKLGPMYRLPRSIRTVIGKSLRAAGKHRMKLAGEALLQSDILASFVFMRTMRKDFPLDSVITPGAVSAVEHLRSRVAGAPLLDDVALMSRLDTVSYLPDDILQKVDVASMAYGLEVRAPLLDHRIVEFSQALPTHFKLRNGQSKWLLRQVLYKYVPQQLVDRPKAGFGAPIREWFRGDLKSTVQEYLSPNRVSRIDGLNPQGVDTLIQLHLSGRRDTHPLLWSLMMLMLWRDTVLSKPAASPAA